ncbi:MAG: DUF5698 domain-containing protein [Actinomycetota bacterium]|nr:DUF5698 domain-containing protein [Actinomycetota bacterium]
MEPILGALLIFGLRICDVSIGTLRSLYVVRGIRRVAVPLAFAESMIWIFAMSKIMGEITAENYYNMFAYSAGFATGTLLGITIERWIASGWILVRIITKEDALTQAIRGRDFGVTEVQGEGRFGEQALLFIVAPRRRGNELLELVREIDKSAFVTVDAVNTAMGGYLPSGARLAAASATAVRK